MAQELNPDAFPWHNMSQDHGIDKALDHTLIAHAQPALSAGHKVYYETSVNNLNRTVGAMLSNKVASKYGAAGLPDDTIHVKLNGSAGQSLGFVLAKGITLEVEGDANDGVGKGLSGGRIVVYPHQATLERHKSFKAENNVIVGNVACYGATSGQVFFRGLAGERFCVRNSGATAVCEGVGDHGCEYMTGGRAVILGPTGRNFSAGMSGGIAYVYDPDGAFPAKCNTEMVALERVEEPEEEEELRSLVEKHRRYTGSPVAKRLLDDWEGSLKCFVKVYPHDFKKVMEESKKAAQLHVQIALNPDQLAKAAAI
jgi:glutamate synthase (NADPH/NADH) large chain